MKEMMHKITMTNELVFQNHHVPFITEKERVIVSKHFAAHPCVLGHIKIILCI